MTRNQAIEAGLDTIANLFRLYALERRDGNMPQACADTDAFMTNLYGIIDGAVDQSSAEANGSRSSTGDSPP